MNTLSDREKWNIGKIAENSSYYSTLPERRRTEAVSMAAVLASGENLEHVPDYALTPGICRAALTAQDAGVDILSKIPFPDVQKDGIKMFLDRGEHPFIVYSFSGISDVEMARNAVRGDAYCLQLVPGKLLTPELCKIALKSPNADEKVLKFVQERFPGLQPEDEKPQRKAGVKMKF